MEEAGEKEETGREEENEKWARPDSTTGGGRRSSPGPAEPEVGERLGEEGKPGSADYGQRTGEQEYDDFLDLVGGELKLEPREV